MMFYWTASGKNDIFRKITSWREDQILVKSILTGIISLLVLFSPCCMLSLTAEGIHAVEGGALLYHISYVETLPDTLKSTETGWLTGFRTGYEYFGISNPVMATVQLEYTYSHTKYDGTTQTGTPVTTTTHNHIFDIEGTLGFIALRPTFTSLLLVPYIGFGYRNWYRGLVDNNSYYEIYSWYYLPVGCRAEYILTPVITVGIDISYWKMIGGKIKVALSRLDSGYNNPESNLGNKYGYKIKLPVKYRFRPSWNIIIEPWYEYFKIGRGETFDITYNGSLWGQGYEPSSRTCQYGICITAQYLF